MPPKGYKHISEITLEEWNESMKRIPKPPKETIEGKQANPNKETE